MSSRHAAKPALRKLPPEPPRAGRREEGEERISLLLGHLVLLLLLLHQPLGEPGCISFTPQLRLMLLQGEVLLVMAMARAGPQQHRHPSPQNTAESCQRPPSGRLSAFFPSCCGFSFPISAATLSRERFFFLSGR